MLSAFKKSRDKHKDTALYRNKAMTYAYYLQDLALYSKTSGLDILPKQHEIIISLTSYPARINDVYLTIESLFQQSVKANSVVLWLSLKNFPNGFDELPQLLKSQTSRGLEIFFVEDDIGSYKKFFYAVEKYPKNIIITVDDDIMYPVDFIDQLYRNYLTAPNVIHCQRACRISISPDGNVQPYHKWKAIIQAKEPSFDLFPLGVGGVLYFPGCFHNDVLDSDKFMRLAPRADDVWFKAMSLLNRIPCQIVSDERSWRSRFLEIEGSQKSSLWNVNKHKHMGNDKQIKQVFDHYNLNEFLN